MNEERGDDELRASQRRYDETLQPGTKPIAPRERYQEFDQQRGEVQQRGSRDAMGNPPPLPPAPVGIAPPDPMNVVSNFDTRPVGAFDFAMTDFAVLGPGEVDTFAEVFFDVPQGYTAALRRVVIELLGGFTINLGSDGSNPPPNVFSIALMRDAGVIPHNTRRFIDVLSSLDWPTHQVFGFWEKMGIRLSGDYAIPGNVAETVTFGITMMGVLIPTKGRPPAIEIASDPVLVRDYDRFVKQPPKVGAAG